MHSSKLSEKAKNLIAKSQIIDFTCWNNLHTYKILKIFQQVNELNRYFTNDDLENIKKFWPEQSRELEKVKLLREQANSIINYGKEQVLNRYPKIVSLNGALYPEERAQTCWRDFWHFLRCITYAIAANNTQFTDQQGLKNMRLLYKELEVPLDAMIWGLENMKIFSLHYFNAKDKQDLKVYFDHLINNLKNF